MVSGGKNTNLGKTCAIVLFYAFFGHLAHAASNDELIASWVQFTALGAEARVVTLDKCPEVEIDGELAQMTVRAAPTAAHPNTVCTVAIAEDSKSVNLFGNELPVPKARARNIVIIGDTGCRVSDTHGLYQACDIDTVWPFAQVAAKAAEARPDAIIHTGDFIYRESECPEGNVGCEGTPVGDTAESWMADWFLPAKPLFTAAPLLLVRGNHETCSRAGTGYFRYLGPREDPAECPDSTESWTANLGGLEVGVIDSANLTDAEGDPLTGHFADQLSDLDAVLPDGSWLTAHHPFWGFGADDDTGEPVQFTDVLQAAVGQVGLPEGAELLLGSHIHLIEVLDFGGEAPPQIVVGNGGTQLVDRVPSPDDVAGMPIRMSKVLFQYGFVSADIRNRNKRIFTLRDVEGRPMAQCRLGQRRMTCQ